MLLCWNSTKFISTAGFADLRSTYCLINWNGFLNQSCELGGPDRKMAKKYQQSFPALRLFVSWRLLCKNLMRRLLGARKQQTNNLWQCTWIPDSIDSRREQKHMPKMSRKPILLRMEGHITTFCLVLFKIRLIRFLLQPTLPSNTNIAPCACLCVLLALDKTRRRHNYQQQQQQRQETTHHGWTSLP